MRIFTVKHFTRALIAAALVALLILPASVHTARADDDADLERVDFFLTFIPNIQFAPIYVMDGLLREHGYYLDMQYLDENIGVDLLANNSLSFGIASGEQIIMARAAGRPVVYVYQWFQQFPVGIVIPDTTGAQTMTDLTGLRVGVPGRFGANYAGLTAILNVSGMSEDDIRLESIGFAAPDVICAGGVDAAAVYVNNEPFQIQRRAERGECGDISAVTVLPVSDYGDIVSNGLVTNEATIADDPDKVALMVDAFDAALRLSINNPALAYLNSAAYVDDLPLDDALRDHLSALAEAQADFLSESPDRDAITASREAMAEALREAHDAEMLLQFEVFLLTIDLWDAEVPGAMSPDAWIFTRDLIQSMGDLVAPLDDDALSRAYTADFLPVDEA